MIPTIIHKSMRQLTASVAVLLSLACVFSCKKEKGGGDALEKIYFVDPASATMVITQGRSEQILYATVPEKAADTAILEWFSDDPSIADVINGLVTAIAPGNTVITAKCGNVTATVDVQVVPIPVTSFSVPKTMSAYMEMPVQIKLTLEPAEANAASLEWKSDNPEIAEVVIEDGKAIVNAKKEGGCKISVSPYGRSDESKDIAVTVYPAAFKLMRRTISGESGYVEIPNEDSFDITDIGMPSEDGKRSIEMIRVDGSSLLESSVEVYNENSGIVSITKRKRSEIKILLEAEEKSEVGSAKVSVSLKEDDNVYTKTFTITRQKHDFTSDTKICRMYSETPVNDVEEMARNATMQVQMFPAVNAVWTSSNESVAKVESASSDGVGFSPWAMIKTFGEYGSAEITATDESGEHTRKFTVKVSKASFPAGTKIGIRVGGKIEPVGESTTIRASYDGRNDEGFCLMDASGNYLTTFTNFKWTIESPSCECRLATAGASGVVVTPISATTFSGSKTATLVCTDDAGNRLTHKIFIDSPNAFSGVQNLRVTVDGKSYTGNAKVDIGKTATIDIAKLTVDSSYDGLKWENVGVLGSVYGTTKLNNNSSGSLMSIEFTPNRKMEAMPISVEDEIGQVKKIYISSAKFHFPDGAKIYISYDKSKWNTLDERVFLNNGQNYFRVGTSATDFVKSDTPVEWSRTKTSSTNYEGGFRALPGVDVSTYAISPIGYPDDYEAVYYSLSAKDDYGTVVRSKFVLKKFMNFNDGIWFRLQYAYRDKYTIKHKTLTYKFESGKDTYVTLPYNDYHTVMCSCSPNESGSSAYYNHAEIMDFDELPYSLRTEKPACDSRVWTIKEQYARITFYDDYGNKKAFYIIRK
ncbi:MAG: Ig-like domain-containing protein [Bacteroidales bacterium]